MSLPLNWMEEAAVRMVDRYHLLWSLINLHAICFNSCKQHSCDRPCNQGTQLHRQTCKPRNSRHGPAEQGSTGVIALPSAAVHEPRAVCLHNPQTSVQVCTIRIALQFWVLRISQIILALIAKHACHHSEGSRRSMPL